MKQQSNLGILKKRSSSMLSPQDTGVRRLLIILVAVIVLFSILQPEVFLTRDYIVSMLYLFPEFGILALGMMLCMISGGIDLSVVSTANLSGIVCCFILAHTVPENATSDLAVTMLLVSILAAVSVGICGGLLNGFLISKLGIPPILATLGGSDLIMGIALAFTKGSSISNLPSILSNVGTYHLFGILPVTLVVYLICAFIISWRLEKTTYGYKLYMLGSNAKASRYAGVDNDKIILQTYITSGILAAIAGVLMCARYNSARAGVGASYTMQAILISVLGGTDPNGGFGTVQGVIVATLILQVLSSGFNMFPFLSNFYRDLIWGIVLILVMAYNHLSNLYKLRKERETLYINK